MSARLAWPVMCRGRVSHPWFFLARPILLVRLTLALDQQTVSAGREDGCVYVWHQDCRLSTGIFGIAAIIGASFRLFFFFLQSFTLGKMVTLWGGITK